MPPSSRPPRTRPRLDTLSRSTKNPPTPIRALQGLSPPDQANPAPRRALHTVPSYPDLAKHGRAEHANTDLGRSTTPTRDPESLSATGNANPCTGGTGLHQPRPRRFCPGRSTPFRSSENPLTSGQANPVPKEPAHADPRHLEHRRERPGLATPTRAPKNIAASRYANPGTEERGRTGQRQLGLRGACPHLSTSNPCPGEPGSRQIGSRRAPSALPRTARAGVAWHGTTRVGILRPGMTWN